MTIITKVSVSDYVSPIRPQWCPGCGNYVILNILRQVLSELNIPPYKTVVLGGIGCGSRIPFYIRSNGFHTIHGRPIPIALGIKIARHDLNVIVVAGDGDTYGIGVAHFIHAARSNVGITVIVQNNSVFGLTRGQPSPTAPKGFREAYSESLDPISLALASGATFVARAWTGDPRKLKEIFTKAIEHSYVNKHGFSFVDVIQLCVIYNPTVNGEPFMKYYKDRVIYVDELSDYDVTSKSMAYKYLSEPHNNKIPMGVFYHDDTKPSLEEEFGLYEKTPLGLLEIDKEGIDISSIIETVL